VPLFFGARTAAGNLYSKPFIFLRFCRQDYKGVETKTKTKHTKEKQKSVAV
jgi:hypothetical protein